MRASLYLLAAAALGAAGLYWLWNPESAPAKASATAVDSTPLAVKESAATAPPTPNDRIPVSNSPDYGRMLREATDLLPLTEMLHQRATNGEAAAQYWLSRALPICEEEYESMFWDERSANSEATLDHVLQKYATDRSKDLDDLRAWHARCQRVREAGVGKFGELGEWLVASASGGYPLGQISLAREYALLYHNSATDQGKLKLQELRQLALDALRDGDPEVVMQAGSMVFFLGMQDDAVLAERAKRSWILAACLRGADCGPRAEWVRTWRRGDLACQPFEAGPDLIRRHAGPHYEELERRAREINAIIDAGKWDELEFE
jgi:hypothetical protein